MNAGSGLTRVKSRFGGPPPVLVIQPDAEVRGWIEEVIRADNLCVLSYATVSVGEVCLGKSPFACAIFTAPPADSAAVQLQCELSGMGVAVLYVTASQDISSCVRAMRAGAMDYLTLPCDAARLRTAIRQAIDLTNTALAILAIRNDLLRRFDALTGREREVFALVSSGLLNKQVAWQLDISEITVQIHRGRVMRKMEARSFADLVRMADALGIEPTPHKVNAAPLPSARAMAVLPSSSAMFARSWS